MQNPKWVKTRSFNNYIGAVISELLEEINEILQRLTRRLPGRECEMGTEPDP